METPGEVHFGIARLVKENNRINRLNKIKSIIKVNNYQENNQVKHRT